MRHYTFFSDGYTTGDTVGFLIHLPKQLEPSKYTMVSEFSHLSPVYTKPLNRFGHQLNLIKLAVTLKAGLRHILSWINALWQLYYLQAGELALLAPCLYLIFVSIVGTIGMQQVSSIEFGCNVRSNCMKLRN